MMNQPGQHPLNIVVRETTALPEGTMIVPLALFDELREAVRELDIEVRLGHRSGVVSLSPDLFAAFVAWDNKQ